MNPNLSQQKNLYGIFCKKNNLPLFFQPWWLDAVCGPDNWHAALCYNKEHQIIGVLPYFLTKKRGFKIIKMPPLTPYLGPWIIYPPDLKKQSRIYSFENKVLANVYAQLPNYSYYIQNCHYQLNNWLPLYWKSYFQTTRFSYHLKDISDLKAVYNNFSKTTRQHIKKAQHKIEVVQTDELDLVYQLISFPFTQRHMPIPYSLDLLLKVDQTLKERNQRAVFLALNNKKTPISALYIAWDNQSAYTLASGSNPELGLFGEKHCLIWSAIQEASKHAKTFDFAGSMLKGVEPYVRSFGGVRQPYFQIYKGKNKFWEVIRLLFLKRSI